MRHRLVLVDLGYLVLMLCPGLGAATVVALYSKDEASTDALLITLGITFALGLLFRYAPGPAAGGRFGRREAFAVVTFGWIALALVGALPLYLSGTAPTYTDAFFETMSGFTTTGASVIPDVQRVPRAILLWRSLTHWYGGMGIVVLGVGLFPALQVGGAHLFTAESSGLGDERLLPRIAGTARLLWWVYILLTVSETLLLRLGGMSLFDSLCHAFGTVATGGFSTRNQSIAAYGPYVQWVITAFMWISAWNFALHYRFLATGRLRAYAGNAELRFYALIGAASTIVVATVLVAQRGWPALERSLRESAFTIASVSTATGFSITDFDLWPAGIKILLLALMVMGGCAGSTAGGLKAVRVLLLGKLGWCEARRLLHRHSVVDVHLGRETVRSEALPGVFGIFILYLVTLVVASVTLTGIVGDSVPAGSPFETVVSAVITTLGGVGPGLGGVGPAGHFGWIPPAGKWLLAGCMLLGRLEFVTVLVLLVPATWRR